MYCSSIDGEHFNQPRGTKTEAKKEALEMLQKTGDTKYWIGECVDNRPWDFVDSRGMLERIWDNMEWEDYYPSEDALDDLTDEDFDVLDNALGKVLAAFARKTGKLNFGTHIENITEYSIKKKG